MLTREPIRPADALREPGQVSHPDPRSDAAAEQTQESLLRQHQRIAQFVLADSVPTPVAIQFETAKNLYLYAWYVYRFYPAAESLALTTLEFGLRERMEHSQFDVANKQRRSPPTLPILLRQAVEIGLIRNEGFQRWHDAGQWHAIERHRMESLIAAAEQNLDSIEIDDRDAVVTSDDRNWDLVEVLLSTLHKHRNMHAHGGPYLTPHVLGTFELVMEILNQLFASPATASY
jgi:hypothetical protein